jgi:hypothetical protein
MPSAPAAGLRIHAKVQGSGVPLGLQVGCLTVVADGYQLAYVAALRADYRAREREHAQFLG